MARYVAVKPTLVSHLCRVVQEGEEFDADFPSHMIIKDNLRRIDDAPTDDDDPVDLPVLDKSSADAKTDSVDRRTRAYRDMVGRK